jgi:IQ domain-containing protein H
VNGYPCVEDIDLAIRLEIPLFNGNPEKSKIVSSKSGSVSLLKSVDIPTAPSRGSFKNEKEILRGLAELTYDYKAIMTWVFKIDEEFNGRGIATLNLETVKIINQLRENKGIPRENAIISIEEILSNVNNNTLNLI